MQILVKKLEKLDKISRVKWLSGFPSLTDKVWNGDLQRQEALLIKDIDSYPKKDIKKAVRETDCKKYYMSANAHTGLIGLDTEDTPQGGGIIAQSDSFEETERIAFEVYGINKYFIY